MNKKASSKSASDSPASGKKPSRLPEGAETRAASVLELLARRYPHPVTYLAHATPWQLLVATVLSAQCTDDRVNMVTPELFRRWPTPEAMAAASIADIESVIHSTGFYHNKARNLQAAGKTICETFGGKPPRTIAELVTVPGVARKTANIVLFGGYGLNEGIAVDTHVKRISYRLGLTSETAPVRVEQDLMRLFPQPEWGNINHRLVQFGRDVCIARAPRCTECEMAGFCPRLTPPKAG